MKKTNKNYEVRNTSDMLSFLLVLLFRVKRKMIWVRITPINKNNKTGPHDNDINSGLTNAIIVNTTNTS